jgi:hypothetical protein
MKNKYPILIQKDGNDYLVYIPDVNQYTSGRTPEEARVYGAGSVRYSQFNDGTSCSICCTNRN